MSLDQEQALQTIRAKYQKAAPLELGDVLWSLQSDSRDWESTFEDWCDEMGEDSDSRRAYRVFEACQNTAKTIRKAFGSGEFQIFRELEEM